MYYFRKLIISNEVTPILSQNAQFQYIISHTVQFHLSQLSMPTEQYIVTSHCHNDLDCSSSKLVSHSLLELLKRMFVSRHSIMDESFCEWNIVFGILYSAVNYRQ